MKTTLKNQLKRKLGAVAKGINRGQITLLFLVLYSLYLTGCESSKGQGNTAPSLPSVPISSPEVENITEWDEYMGRFRAMEKVEVRSRISGYIESVNFQDGDMVNKGDILFVIDQRPFLIALKQAEARLTEAKAEYSQAKSAFERVKPLHGSKAISQEEYDQREQSFLVSEAHLEAAEADVNNAKLNLEFTRVRAPISGKVSEDYVNVGNLISGGSAQATLLTTIVSTDPIYFYFEGNEKDLLKYSQYQNGEYKKITNNVYITFQNEEDYEHVGKIDFIDNEIDKGTGTFQGRAIFPNPEHKIESGMFANARIEYGSKHEMLLIPDAAVLTDQSRKILLTLSDSNTVVPKAIELGPLYSNELRIIRNGITSKDRIIVGNLQKIRPGMTVKPMEKTLAKN